MLNHLHIQNYRLFRDLHIDKLGQVNLIAGKNNTGKTALLEALRIVSCNRISQLNNELSLSITARGDFDNENRFSTIFNNNKLPILINKTEIKSDRKYTINSVENHGETIDIYRDAREYVHEGYTSVSIDTHGKINDLLWNEIVLTPEQNDAIKVLQIIDSKIVMLSVNSGQAKILLNGQPKPIPFKNLGDGANRLLTLALALVNAKNKMLLIDEFEVGLHHSVQEQLWEIIFKYAKEWNIQVFATTHSQDTLRAFYYVAEKTSEYKEMANYFTLNRKNDGDVKAINYDFEDIETAFMANLEIR
jgi:AAA15 family ATPase/GTPase